MHIRNNDLRHDKKVIPRDKLNDDELDKIVAQTSTELVKIEHNLNDNIEPPETSSSSSSCIEDKQDKQSHSLAQPKRPMNAFMVWGQCIRRELHNRYTNVQNAMLSKALGRVWKRLDIEEKKPYLERASIIKANHKRDYPNYRYQPRRIQERRARQLKDANKIASDLTDTFVTDTAVHLHTQYPDPDFVASYKGNISQDNFVSHSNDPIIQRTYTVQERYPGGNNEPVEMDHHQHEMSYNSQPQETGLAACYYDQTHEVPAILEYHNQQNPMQEHQEATQYLAYGQQQQTRLFEEDDNLIYAQCGKYSGPVETLDQNQNKMSLQNNQQQPYQYYAPAHSDTMYYLAPKVGRAEVPFSLESFE